MNSSLIVDGNWGKWTDFGECSKTCGDGLKKRMRECNNPAPKYGGKSCEGDGTDSEPCKDIECPGISINTIYLCVWIIFVEDPE